MNIIPKSAIPDYKVFVVKELNAPYFDPTFHFHPEYQLSLVLKGEGTRFVGNSIRPFKAGDLVLTGPNLPHVWRNDNAYFEKKNQLSTHVIVIYFNEYFLGEAIHKKEEMANINLLFHRSICGLEITGKTHNVISKMMREILPLQGIDSIILLLKILDTMARSSECHSLTQNPYIFSNTEVETDRMNKVYEYVMKNSRGKISLEEIAAIASMTPTSFSRYFKSRVNKSFSDFLKEIRIDYACKLLKADTMNINQVGYECGFQTLSNFNKQFKRVTGKQPHLYRSEYLKLSSSDTLLDSDFKPSL